MAHSNDLTEIRRLIRTYLAEDRPDRYGTGETPVDRADEDDEPDLGSQEWLRDIAYDKIKPLVTDAAERLALQLVLDEERKATRATNAFFRDIARDHQLVLGYFGLESSPISVVHRVVRDGKLYVRTERAALRAADERDVHSSASEERRRAGRDFAARNAACDGMEWAADQMLAAGALTFDEWVKGYTGE